MNNFGFGGSNAHVILEETSGYLASHGLSDGSHGSPTNAVTKHGLTNGFTNGMTNDLTDGLMYGLTNGLASGLINRRPKGIASNEVNGSLEASNVHDTKCIEQSIEPFGDLSHQEMTNIVTKVENLSANHLSVVHRSHVFVLSASDEQSVKRQAHALSCYLQDYDEDEAFSLLRFDLSYTLGSHRSILPWKLAFTANSLTKVVQSLSSDCIKLSRSVRSKALGFVFTGQGAQWHAMGRELISRYPVFKQSLQSADEQLQHLGASWSLLCKSQAIPSTSQQCLC